MSNQVATGHSAIVIAREENKLKAVELKKQDGAFEVVWTKSGQSGDDGWSAFAAECGLSTVGTKHRKATGGRIGVVGFESTGVAFYRIDAPVVGDEETEAMVKMQAETILPLPPEQMELTWRRGPVRDGKVGITIAAARRESLQTLLDGVRDFEPARILLDCEGTVRAWKVVFSGREKDAIVVSLTARSTQVCLVEDGQLSNAVVLDIGVEDLLDMAPNLPGAAELLEQTEVTERFLQDMRSVLESFGYAEHVALPILVLSDGSSTIQSLISYLRSAGINARAVLPAAGSLRTSNDLSLNQLYEYRLPIGLGLMALQAPADALDLFANLYDGGRAAKKSSALYSPKVAGVIALILLAVSAAVWYGLDVATERRLTNLQAKAGFQELLQRQALMKTVARQRPDLLQLLSEMSSGENRGVTLDSFYFKKGQPVTISGQVQGNEQLYDFHKNLLGKKGITDVNIQNTSRDNKTKKVSFTMTFHYKTFTKKSPRS